MMQDHRNVVGEPDKLLAAFKENLTDTGGIRQTSIPELISLMSNTNGKLVPKCISLCIISASDNASRAQICQEGAWDILLKWLQEALKEDDQSFLYELLTVYLNLPVKFNNLKQNVCPKLINSLSKRCENRSVRSLAGDIVKKWKEVINRETCDSNSGFEPPVKKSKPEVEKKEDNAIAESDAFSKDTKKRRSTVKMPPTVMRTAGIEESVEQIPPKPRVNPRKTKIDVSEKVPSGLPIESFHQKITVVPSETKKPLEVHESPDFINALTTQTYIRKKRKTSKPDLQATPDSVVNSDEPKKSVIEQPEAAASPTSNEADLPKKSSMASLSSLLVVKKPKKRVSWAPEEKLQAISFFEVEENERVNVNRVSLAEIRQKELSSERQLFKRHEEIEITDAKWQVPAALDLTILVEPGSKSIERQIQLERERFVLQAIYFDRNSVPVSPEEPEKEEFEAKLAVEIPLEDLHSKEISSEGEDLLIIKSEGDGKSKVSLNPEVADLVQSLAFSFNPGAEPSNCLSSIRPSTAISPTTTSGKVEPIKQEERRTNSNDSELRGSDPFEPSTDRGPSLSSAPAFISEISETPSIPTTPRLRGSLPIGPPPHRPLHNGESRGGPGGFSHRPPRFAGERPLLRPPPPGFVGRPPFRGPQPLRMFGQGRPPPGMGPRGPSLNPPRRGSGRGEQICKFFQQGSCRNGNNCHFLHPGFPNKSNW